MDDHRARVEAMRQEKDAWFRASPDSPLPGRASFRGLSYFAVDPALRFRAKLVPHAEPKTVVMQTSDGDAREYRNVGHFEIAIEGHPVQVHAYRARGSDDLFVPFRDATSGKETYGAGRYLDLHAGHGDDAYDLDFNLAYNPMCAYNEAFSCPFPPPENWLQVPIRAGERTYAPG